MMTPQEAIEALVLEGGLEISGNSKRVAEFFEGLQVAIEALEKQIAKKSDNHIEYDEDEAGVAIFNCPNCGNQIMLAQKHCDDCGQKIYFGE